MTGLDPQPLGNEPQTDRLGNQTGVDQRRFARARVAIEHHSAVDRDQARQAVRLFSAREEDRVIEVAKSVNPAKRDRRDLHAPVLEDRYGESSFPSTSSYSLGTNAHTSCAMNFTYRRWLCQTSKISGSGW